MPIFDAESNFDISTIQNFSLISVNPPSDVNELDDTIKKVEEKKQWYLDNGDAKLAEQIE